MTNGNDVIEPGRCPECNKWNTYSATQCVWCHAPMPATAQNTPKKKIVPYAVIAVAVAVAFGAGIGIMSLRGTPAPVAIALAAVPSSKPTPVKTVQPPPMAAPQPTIIPVAPARPVAKRASTPRTETDMERREREYNALPAYRASWHEVARYSGTSSKSTETFRITGDQWRITWSSETESNGMGSFSIIVKRSSGEWKQLAANVANSNSDDATIVRGAGDFYLDIGGFNCNYGIIVSEYY